jgi:hypothetical protein
MEKFWIKLTEKKNLNLHLRKNTSVHSSIILIALFFTLQVTLDLNLLGIDFLHVVKKKKLSILRLKLLDTLSTLDREQQFLKRQRTFILLYS